MWPQALQVFVSMTVSVKKTVWKRPLSSGTSICRSASRSPMFGHGAKNGAFTVLAGGRRFAYTSLRTLWLQCWLSSSEAHAHVWAFAFSVLPEQHQIQHGPLLCVRWRTGGFSTARPLSTLQHGAALAPVLLAARSQHPVAQIGRAHV